MIYEFEILEMGLVISVVITPHVCDVSGVIVLTSSVCVCLSVCVLPLSRLNGQTYNFGM